MSVWNHLPLELHGAVLEARWPVWPGDVVYWYWRDADGTQRRECRSSISWARPDPMTAAMRCFYQWWVLTGRDDALRSGLYVDPWKSFGDTWEWVGMLDPDSRLAWPWPRSP